MLVVLVINYWTENGETQWLPAGNLCTCIVLLFAMPSVHFATPPASMPLVVMLQLGEGLVLAMLYTIPISYGITLVSDNAFQYVLPLTTFGCIMVVMGLTVFDEGLKFPIGQVIFLCLFSPRLFDEMGAPNLWYALKLLVNVLMSLAIMAGFLVIPLPLPPHYRWELPLAIPRVRRLQAQVRSQSELLLTKLVEAACTSSFASIAALHTLFASVDDTQVKLDSQLPFACLELIAALRAPDVASLKAAVASDKSESALLARAIAVLSTAADASSPPPLACADASMRVAMNNVATALNAPEGVTANQVHALATSLQATYTAGGRRRSILRDSAGGAAALMHADAFVATLVQLATARAAALKAAEAVASAKPATLLQRLAAWRVFSKLATNLCRPFKPLWTGPIGQWRSWVNRYNVQSLKFALCVATASMWVSDPTLNRVSNGQGSNVGVNLCIIYAPMGIYGSAGSTYRKAADRVVGNSVACMFVLVVDQFWKVTDVKLLCGIGVVWAFLCLLCRPPPPSAYVWTNMAYTYFLAIFSVTPTDNNYLIFRIGTLFIAILWWLGFELLFYPLGTGYPSNAVTVWTSVASYGIHMTRSLECAATALAAPAGDSRKEALDGIAAERIAASANLVEAKGAMIDLPFEPDHVGLNTPAPKPVVAGLLEHRGVADERLACLVAAVQTACESGDEHAVSMLAERFVQPVAAQFGKIHLLLAERLERPFDFLASHSELGVTHKQLLEAYDNVSPALADAPGQETTRGCVDARLAVSSAVWALLELCSLGVKDGKIITLMASDWKLWDDPVCAPSKQRSAPAADLGASSQRGRAELHEVEIQQSD